MIRLDDLKESDKGREVRYEVRGGQPGEAYYTRCEFGKISSWNSRFIFVRYQHSGTAQATDLNDLEFTL